jgi:putative membrane protein
MKIQTGVVCLAAGALTLLGGSLQAQQRGTMSSSDRNFMREAAAGSIAEVRLGRLAVERGERPSVREFGQRMVADHSKANDRLRDLARNKGISLPNEMNEESLSLYRRLSRLHGAAFDSAYIQAMKDDHAKDIEAFRKEARNGRDSEVRAFADNTLPTLRDHSRMVDALYNSSRLSMHRNSYWGLDRW